jgi:hypothetical protein
MVAQQDSSYTMVDRPSGAAQESLMDLGLKINKNEH